MTRLVDLARTFVLNVRTRYARRGDDLGQGDAHAFFDKLDPLVGAVAIVAGITLCSELAMGFFHIIFSR